MKFINTFLFIVILSLALFGAGQVHAGMKTCWHLKNGVKETDPFAFVPSNVNCPEPPRHDCNGNVMPPPGGTQSCSDNSHSNSKESANSLSIKPSNNHVKTCPECHHCYVHEQDGGPI